MAVNPATQFYTYLHCKPDGTPFYVGKGSDGKRKRSHDFHPKRRNAHHSHIIAKYGAENIKVFIFPCDSEQQAFNDEIQQIAQLRRDGLILANIYNGGEGSSGIVVTAETRKKLSAANKGRIHTEASRKNMSVAHKGQISWIKGKTHSEETKEKLRAANIGKTPTPETRKKLSEAHKGRVITAETREKLRNANIGRIMTPEDRAKMSAKAKGKKVSTETRSKMSAAQVVFWASSKSEDKRKAMSDRTKASWVIRKQKKEREGNV